jgi:predicted DNA-binding protein (UPF0251 family)
MRDARLVARHHRQRHARQEGGVSDKPKAPALEPQHWRYIQLRLLGATNQEAAQELGVERQTTHRWGTIPEVREELALLIRDNTESAARLLRASVTKAAKKIVALTDSEDEGIALRAATTILERVPETQADVLLAEVPSTGDPWGGE